MKAYITILLLVIALISNGATYYVSPTGDDDNAGTIDKPWATWQKAFNTARAGDTVYFRGGVYYKPDGYSADIIPRDGHGYSGTADNYIHYFNYPGETPILDCSLITPNVPGSGFSYNCGLYIDGANYLHFRGLTIRNVKQVYDNVLSQGLVSVSCKFQIFENMTIHDIGGRGIYYSPDYAPDSTYFINCDIYNCIDSYETGGLPGGWGDGFNVGNENNSYLHLEGCRVWNVSDDGFNLWGSGLLVVKNCWAFENGRLDGDGCGFKMNVPDVESTDNDLHRIFTNNISTYNKGNTGAGFTENNNGMVTVRSQMYNNTSYKNLTGFTTIGNNVGPQRDNIYRNNIAYDNSQYNDEESQGGVFYINDHNSWNTGLGVTVTDADFVSLDVEQLCRPRKEDGSLPDIDFLKLSSSSDLINKGIDVGLPYNGSAPDIGYSEYNIPVSLVTVTSEGGSTTITEDNGTLQLYASVTPEDASEKSVTWSIQSGTVLASVNTSGQVKAISNGTVTVRATANDGSGVYGQFVITISNQEFIPVAGITVTGIEGSSSINTNKGTLQLIANITPANAENKNVTWSLVNGTGKATINSTGLVTAVSNGLVTAKATAIDGSGIFDELVITISNQVVLVTSITVTGAGGSKIINTNQGTLQLSAAILPNDATNKSVTWSVTNGTGKATINTTGLVTAVSNGTVTARATAKDGSGKYGQLVITISNQYVTVSDITVTGEGGSKIIDSNKGTLQLIAAVLPASATNKAVTWSVSAGTGQANINSSGLLIAVANGTVTAKATAKDGSGVSGTLVVTISNQITFVETIVVSAQDNQEQVISQINGNLQMVAEILPEKASIKTVKWSVENHTGNASVDANGLLTGKSNGTVKVTAKAQDGSNISGYCMVTIEDGTIPTNIDNRDNCNFNAYQLSGNLIIHLNEKLEAAYCNIYSITGSLMHKEEVVTNPIMIDITSYPKGIYIVSFTYKKSIFSGKFIIQ